MPIMNDISMESKAAELVAMLMAISARTAPKARGVDSLVIKVISGQDLAALAKEMRRLAEDKGAKSFSRDSHNLEQSDACLLIGSESNSVANLNCGGCGFASCQDMLAAKEAAPTGLPYRGPNCAIRMTDLGIGLGSAAKTAGLHNLDSRIMFSAGAAALSIGWLEGCQVAFAIPIKASAKSIYFDRPSA
ncbi:MAG: hypothetical protein A4E45_01718 [Methanosaeta sp. PtaB.Bin039]|nr:MAG: hypothetical protein A4E45_01718 [Methanosaeta sp. PtaB.Bin039]